MSGAGEVGRWPREWLRLNSADFQNRVRGQSGIAWGAVQKMLAGYLPETISDGFQWVYDQNLVARALTEILGEGGWKADRRPSPQSGTRTWITITGQARPSRVPDMPPDWRPDDQDGPPPDGGILF